MHQSNKEALREILGGLIPILLGFAIAGVFIFAMNEAQPPADRFEVVDEYQGCDVVRWVSPSNRYEFFLDCHLGGSDAPSTNG